jgi:hypothetical protein
MSPDSGSGFCHGRRFQLLLQRHKTQYFVCQDNLETLAYGIIETRFYTTSPPTSTFPTPNQKNLPPEPSALTPPDTMSTSSNSRTRQIAHGTAPGVMLSRSGTRISARHIADQLHSLSVLDLSNTNRFHSLSTKYNLSAPFTI